MKMFFAEKSMFLQLLFALVRQNLDSVNACIYLHIQLLFPMKQNANKKSEEKKRIKQKACK